MRNIAVVVLSALAFALAGVPGAVAGEGHGAAEKGDATAKQAMENPGATGHMEEPGDKNPSAGHQAAKQEEATEHPEASTHGEKVACTEPVRLTEAAESKIGGAHYKGLLPKEAMRSGRMRMGAVQSVNLLKSAKEMRTMDGAHNIHKGFRGGEFIMVPNQLHHMEAVYSLECGLQLFMYNAFSEPIKVDRFHAFALILPESGEKFFEVMRFLVPSKNGDVLQTAIAHDHDNPKNPKGLFEIELYVKFPKDIHPRKFDLIVGTEAG